MGNTKGASMRPRVFPAEDFRQSRHGPTTFARFNEARGYSPRKTGNSSTALIPYIALQ